MPDRQIIKDAVFLRMAAELAELGTCDRAQVGAIITSMGRAVSWGYNGAPPGMPHCEENAHGWKELEHQQFESADRPTVEEVLVWSQLQLEIHGCRNVTHAEANAVAFAARQGISTVGGTVYCTYSPCANCARLMIAAGIARAVYNEEYRVHEGIDLLIAAGIECDLR